MDLGYDSSDFRSLELQGISPALDQRIRCIHGYLNPCIPTLDPPNVVDERVSASSISKPLAYPRKSALTEFGSTFLQIPTGGWGKIRV